MASDTAAEPKFAGANWVGVIQIGEEGKVGGDNELVKQRRDTTTTQPFAKREILVRWLASRKSQPSH